MELIIVNDPSKPVLPNVVTAYLRGLVDQQICFSYIYIPRFRDIRIEVHNSFNVEMPFVSGRVIQEGSLLAAIEAWVPTVFDYVEEVPLPPEP